VASSWAGASILEIPLQQKNGIRIAELRLLACEVLAMFPTGPPRAHHGPIMGVLLFLLLASLVTPAHAGFLDLFASSTTGCDEQWIGGTCLAPDVWGGEDSIGIATPYSVPVLTMGTDSAIALAQGTFVASPMMLNFLVKGNAKSSTSKIKVVVRFFDAANTPLTTKQLPVHFGSSGLFGAHVVLRDIPTGAVGWKARLQVEDDGAAIAEAGFSCFGCGGPGEYPPGTEDGGDTGGLPAEDDEGACVSYEYQCDGYTLEGERCPPESCTATAESCSEGFMDPSLLPIQAGVVM
jgi:hypothetical protein